MDRKNRLPPVHPGEILSEDILPKVGLTVTAAAKALGVDDDDPLLALRGSGKEVWADEHADEYVQRLRPTKP